MLLSVQAMELAWVGFNYLGIERTTTAETVRSVADINLAYMPYSHSVGIAVGAALVTWLIIEKGFGRGEENESDEKGIVLANKTGYAPSGLADFLTTLKERNKDSKEKRGLFASHPETKERIEKAVAIVGLSSRLRHLPSQLSGGQQQRVAIARVLAGDPKLILADEPTGNLDSAMAREIMEILDQVNEAGTTIIMVTHNPEHAARAHRQLHIADGRLVDFERIAPFPLNRTDVAQRQAAG